jgi:hypothetical protein
MTVERTAVELLGGPHDGRVFGWREHAGDSLWMPPSPAPIEYEQPPTFKAAEYKRETLETARFMGYVTLLGAPT